VKILLIGKNGQVGRELQRSLASTGDITALDSNELNLAEPDGIIEIVRTIKPNLIINAAAYTAVDKAEAEPELAMAINGIAPGILAEEAKRLDIGLIHYSTDYVFDGAKLTPYTEADEPNPLNIYGKSKLAGERAIQVSGCKHLIFRTSWVYSLHGKNFLLTMLRLLQERKEISVVNDQIGAPTSANQIATITAQIIKKKWFDRTGLYHLTAQGHTSWYDFAKEISLLIGSTCKILPITSSNYPTKAARPLNSRLELRMLEQYFNIFPSRWNIELTGHISALESKNEGAA
jgi:dTDP-4-dehydrorhamnose reductase